MTRCTLDRSVRRGCATVRKISTFSTAVFTENHLNPKKKKLLDAKDREEGWEGREKVKKT